MKEKIIEELYKKLSTTYKVNFIPLEKFEEDFKVVSHDFLKKIKPIEEEYNRIKKTKVSPVILSKADYIREGFYLDPVLKTFPMLPLPQLKHPKDKRTVSFTPQVLEEIIRNELKKYTDNQLKKQFEESYIKLENQYNEAIKKRVEFGFINPLISYAQKKAPALFKLDGFKQNGNVQKIETVENLFKEYISKLALCKDGFLVGKGKVGALGDKGAKLVGKGKAGNKILFLDKPENILKNFRITYLDDYSKYQQLFRNAERFINMEKADFLIKEYEINRPLA